ncbi:MAG: hypothetical protein IPN13_14580 [Bacteroidetes bacterium]|nr:hypothetical protein [Bacteroidota bacterium]
MKPKFKLLFIILLIPALTKSQTLEPVKIIGTDFISGTGKFFPVVMNYSVDAVYRIDQNGNNEYAPEVRVRKFDPLSQVHPSDYEIFIPNTYPYTFTTDMLSQVFQAAETAGLRVLYLSGGKRLYENQYKDDYRDYVDYISFYYANEDILFGYDLFNEPLYNRNINPVGFSFKNVICETTAMFYDGIHDNS